MLSPLTQSTVMEGGEVMNLIIMFLLDVGAQVTGYYLCKWLDIKLRERYGD